MRLKSSEIRGRMVKMVGLKEDNSEEGVRDLIFLFYLRLIPSWHDLHFGLGLCFWRIFLYKNRNGLWKEPSLIFMLENLAFFNGVFVRGARWGQNSGGEGLSSSILVVVLPFPHKPPIFICLPVPQLYLSPFLLHFRTSNINITTAPRLIPSPANGETFWISIF